MGEAILEVRDLRYEQGGKALLDGVSFRLNGGRIYGLLGAPGSGKTVLPAGAGRTAGPAADPRA